MPPSKFAGVLRLPPRHKETIPIQQRHVSGTTALHTAHSGSIALPMRIYALVSYPRHNYDSYTCMYLFLPPSGNFMKFLDNSDEKYQLEIKIIENSAWNQLCSCYQLNNTCVTVGKTAAPFYVYSTFNNPHIYQSSSWLYIF